MATKEEVVAQFGVADYVVFVLMLAVSAAIGVYYACSGQKQKTTKEFLLGNRSMSIIPVAMSILASFLSAITLLGIPAEVYQHGTLFLMSCLGFAIMTPVAAYCYVPVFYNLGVTSAHEYLQLRFNRAVRSVASTIFSLYMLMFMAIVLYAPSLALSQVTGIGLWFAVLSTGLVCTFYTTIGGLKAVVWTDVFQVIMMYTAMIAIVAKGATDVGGMKHVWKVSADSGRLEFFNFDTSVTTRHTVWNLTIGAYFMWVTTYGCNQAMIQRYVSLPSLKSAQKAVWINLPGFTFLTLLAGIAGLVVYTKYHDCDPISVKRVFAPDQLFPLFVMETLGNFPGVPGLFVAGVFSGALSTVSSGVNSLAAVTLEDLIRTYIKPNLSEVWATRLSKILALVYGVVAILLVIVARNLGNVLGAAISILGMIGGPMLSLFTMGMFFPWTNSLGALAGVMTGLAMSFWIGIGAFVNKPYVQKLPTSVESCMELYSNITGLTTNTVLPSIMMTKNDDIFPLYKVSYIWYGVIGCTVSVIVGLIVSFLTGYTKSEDVDVKLLSPLTLYICSSLPKPIRRLFGVERFLNEVVDQTTKEIPSGVVNASFNNDIELEIPEKQIYSNGDVK